ncbi:hypothetical protein GOP47_0013497 [Adiantum capillus-veneris]|uniref:Uncharacterized protein n=1 Tax=Adiantum capillus-veneris TaxID=13818 RepID=A0A9D4ZFU1_ADICA|nr:hypothetical protein GOP47_0013497 [Adiantum capillus-veneris]
MGLDNGGGCVGWWRRMDVLLASEDGEDLGGVVGCGDIVGAEGGGVIVLVVGDHFGGVDEAYERGGGGHGAANQAREEAVEKQLAGSC